MPKPLPEIERCGCKRPVFSPELIANISHWRVLCRSCHRASPWYKTPRGAILAWNRAQRDGQAMSEKPIVVYRHEARALRDGRQTQLRRIVEPQPPEGWHPVVGWYNPIRIDRHGEEYPGSDTFGASDEDFGVKSPYAPGDSLFAKCGSVRVPNLSLTVTGVRIERVQDISEADAIAEGVEHPFSESEVALHPECRSANKSWKNYLWHGDGHKHADAWPYQYSGYQSPRDSFSSLWDSIHGPGAWERNDWVWVYDLGRSDS